MNDSELDLTGMRCPVPIVKLNSAARGLAPGSILRARATDPAFELDVQAWCRRTGHELLQLASAEGLVHATIQLKAG